MKLTFLFLGLLLALFVVAEEAAAPKAEAEKTDDTFNVLSDLGTGVEGHQFKAEISQLMSLIVNSLYSNRDIFLRELVSNSADAIDKIRYMSLTDSSALKDHAQLAIHVKIDKENKILHIRDSGIGMTGADLVKNLGSIAKSGTKEFMKKMKTGKGDVSLIGQFGVGFYSAFLVADKVTVTSKHNDDDQHIWVSSMDGNTAYKVVKDPRGNTLGRGTLVSLHLKEDALEYLETAKVKELITHYNQFITAPIFLWESEVKDAPEPEEKEEKEDKEKKEDKPETEDGLDVEIEEEAEEVKEEPKKITVWDWKQINSVRPLWTRPKSELKDDDYNKFYKETLSDSTDPLSWIHFKAEGDVEFKALLFVPTTPPPGAMDFASTKSLVKLYVKKVFISEKFDSFLPSYLGFIKGVVDSDDFPLNVSREMLQRNRLLKTIQKKLVRKIIKMLGDLMEDEEKSEKFYQAYHQFIKMGVIRDTANRNRLAKLLRFNSAKNPEKLMSLEEYTKSMKEGQEEIYFLGGDKKAALRSPHIERLIKKGYDVLLFTEPIDEYLAPNLGKFDEKYKLTDVSKGGLKLDKDDTKKQEDYKKEYEPLIDYLKTTLKDKVSNVEISIRLSTTPVALVAAQWGHSANMERIIKAQALADKSSQYGLGQKKIMEINPRHPIIKKLLATVDSSETTEDTAELVGLLFDTAAISSGYQVDDVTALAAKMNKVIAQSLGVDKEAVEEEEFPEKKAEEETADEAAEEKPEEEKAEEPAETKEKTEL